MTIPNITRNNTIDEWRIQTNQSANSLNTLETGNYDKISGILSIEGTAAVEITASGTALSVANGALFSTNIAVGRDIALGSEQLATGNLTVGANTFIYGKGTALFVANNAVVNTNLQVTRTITTNNVIANTNVVVGGTTTTDRLLANTTGIITGNLTAGNLNTANAVTTRLLYTSGLATVESLSAGPTTIASGEVTGSLIVGGNFTIQGQTLLDSDTIKLRATTKQTIGAGVGTGFVINRANSSATVNGTNDIITSNGHGFTDGQNVSFISLSTGVTGLSNNTIYRVVQKTDNTFKVASVGAYPTAIDFSTSGLASATLRDMDNPDGQIRWNEVGRYWDLRDVGNTVDATAYSKILTANLVNATTPILYNAGTGVFTHATSGVTAATYGSSTSVPVFVVDDKGHVASVTNTSIRTATTSQTGIVQLNNANNSTSTTEGATANAINSLRLDIDAKITSNAVNFGAATVAAFTFDNSTTNSDPGSGKMRFNNADLSLVSKAFVDNVDTYGNSTSVLGFINSSTNIDTGIIRFSVVGKPTTSYAIYKTSSLVNTIGYREINLIHLSSVGTFTADDLVLVNFTPWGSAGAQGAQGSEGAQGAQGAAGAQGAQGAQGAAGAQGAQGAAGAAGAQGLTGTTSFTVNNETSIVSCISGTSGTGTNNFFAGFCAGHCNTTGSNNNFIGACAGRNNTTGTSNNFFGCCAGFGNTTGSNNNFFGCYAGRSNTSGGNNNFFGCFAGRNNTTGSYNNFFGSFVGFCNTTGSYNNFIGRLVGCNNTTGADNNFFGRYAGRGNTTGRNNNFIGSSAGCCNTTGACNNFFGSSAGLCNTTGCNNNFFGRYAGRNNTTGTDNNFFGNLAGCSNTTGTNNFFAGFYAGGCNTIGSNNNFFGCRAGVGAVGLANITTESNRIIMGNSSHTCAQIQIGWTTVSDIRDKCVFRPVPHGRGFFQNINPIEFAFKDRTTGCLTDAEGKTRYGFSAQEILEAEGDHNVIVSTENADKLQITNDYMIPILVNAIKELSAEVDDIKKQLNNK
jgi:hypothetical protein